MFNLKVFNKRFTQVINTDPIKDFAHECVKSGMTQEQLQIMLNGCPLIGDPFKVRLVNSFRDIKISISKQTIQRDFPAQL
jgi:hypothetical protein